MSSLTRSGLKLVLSNGQEYEAESHSEQAGGLKRIRCANQARLETFDITPDYVSGRGNIFILLWQNRAA